MRNPYFIIILLFFSFSLFSQEVKVTRDLGAWGGVDIEKKLHKDFEINLEQQVRFYSDVTRFDDYIADLGGKYRINKNFKLGANLRYTYNAKRKKENENDFRYNLDLLYKGRISDKFTFYYRLRYQQEFVNLFSEYQKTNYRYSAIRNRVKIQYKLDKINDLFFSAELFRQIELFRDPYNNLVRVYLGDNINTKIGKFCCALGYEQEINSCNPLSFFFLKTIYTVRL